MRAAVWLGVVALLVLAHRYDDLGLLDALPALIAALVGWLFARTLRRGNTPLIARAIAAIDGPQQLVDPRIARYARTLTAIWAVYQFALALFAAALMLRAVPLPGWLAAAWLPAAVAALFLGEFALRPTLLPQSPRHRLFGFLHKLILAWPSLLSDATASNTQTPHWSERREGGGRFAVWLLRTIGLRLGRPVARALLHPITLYFFSAAVRNGVPRERS